MPNPVAANDLQPISGSVQTSRISYGVETAGKNYGQNYNSTTWYSDIPNNGQFYTIISDNYTANYYVSRSNAGGAYVEGGLPAVDEYSAPVFWVTVGTSSLDVTTVVNGLPDRVGKTPFNDGAEALNWIASSSNYFAVGPDYYPQIDADRLGLYLDANQIISYPTTQSTWYDLSGNTQNFTLYNGLKWKEEGWFEFDQADDYALNTTIPYQSSSGTIVVTCYPNSGLDNDYIAGVGNVGTIGGSRAIGVYTNRWWFVGYGSGPQDYTSGFVVNYDRWSHVAYIWDNTTSITASVNGQFESTTKTLVTPTGTYFKLGDPPWGGNYGWWGGFLAKVQFYPKALTQAEMLQNYYGGPIVTDGLVYALDAGNLVSYPRTGTAWYALTGSAGTATLTNGPVFSPADGGLINFDGVDDYAITSNFPSLSNWSTEIWLNPNVYTTAQKVILDVNLGIRFEITNGYFNSHFGNGSGWIYTSLPSTTPIAANTWFHVVVTVDASVNYQAKIYVNGILENTTSTSSGTTPNIPLYIARYTGATGYEFNGKISAIRIYNKALTAAEVLQNYNATN